MAIFYSKEAGFQHEADEGVTIADGAKEVSTEEFDQLMMCQAGGKVIVPDAEGFPTCVDPQPTPVHTWDGREWVASDDALDAYLIQSAQAMKSRLMAQAAAAIAPFQDAVELGLATDGEKERLFEWKRYRVELNRIESQPGYPAAIAWPETPLER